MPIRRYRWLHRMVLWPALLAVLAFVLSGFLHILMTWTGPQPAQALPPQAQFPAADWVAMGRVLQQQAIRDARVVKLVPSVAGNVLQVTDAEDQPRRYFDLAHGAPLPDHDRQQALWLARHYLGDRWREPVQVEFVTTFDEAYPWVNRLLPVYRLHFGGADGLVVSVHTETGALSDISDARKRALQQCFRLLHTAAWLEGVPVVRVLLLGALLVSVLLSLGAGLVLLYGMGRRRIPPSPRRLHRYLAHVAWLPLCAFTASGLYHLLQAEYAQPVSGLRLGVPVRLPAQPLAALDPAALPGEPLQSVALLSLPDGRLFYRASVGAAPPQDHAHHSAAAQREARFAGIPRESRAVYLDAAGQPAAMDDASVARQLAAWHLQLPVAAVLSSQPITRFGDGYDFRNKRLPVWQVGLDTPDADALYIDVATGILADRSNRASRREAWSFSRLHKWNGLTPLLGRAGRDAAIVLLLSLGLLLGLLGGWMARR